MAYKSLTVDSMCPGVRYQVYFTEQMDGTRHILACGGFIDYFDGLFLKDRQLFCKFAEQPPLDVRSITRIEVR